MAWWIWVLAAFVLLALEFATTTMHVGFFAAGALVVGLMEALGIALPLWGELLLFTAVSLAAFVFVRPLLVKRLRLDEAPPVDPLVGETATPLEDIGIAQIGRAELRGTTWSARNVGDAPLTRGQRCTVAGIDGLVIHIKPS